MPAFNLAIVAPPAAPGSLPHVAIAAGVDCVDCHVSSGGVSSSMSLPVVNGANFGNSAFSHKNVAAASCDSCHSAANASLFYGVTIKSTSGLSPVHVPVPTTGGVTCDTCHTKAVSTALIPRTGSGTSGYNFSGGVYQHSTTTTLSCAACHNVDSSFV